MNNKECWNSVAWQWVIWWIIILALWIYCPSQSVEFANKLISDPIAVFTLVLAISTVLLWRDTNGLRRLGAKQSKDMERSLQIAKVAADAAKKSADVAERSLELLERPFLFISELSPVTDPIGNGKCIWFSLQNYGRFPAIIGFAKIVARITTISEASNEFGFDYNYNLVIPPILAVAEKIPSVEYYFPNAIEWEKLADGRYIPKVGNDEVLLLDVLVTYSGGLIKSYVYKERWQYDIGERVFKSISWNMK